jgi:general secretion pathway protein G
MQFNYRRPLGFTLIELLVVLAILALLAGLVGPQVMKSLSDSKSKNAKLQIEEFGAGLDLFSLDIGRYPTTNEGLGALVADDNIRNWNGPYLKKRVIPQDPWGNDYVYRSPGEYGGYDLISLGADLQEGGEGDAADVVSWE